MTRPTLTFLHGFMGAPSDWDEVVAHFPQHPVALPHIRPAKDWADGVEALLVELPKESVWIGYSMGARLLLACALATPERCRGLLFVSGNPGLTDAGARERRWQADLAICERIQSQPRADFLHYWYTESTVFRSLSDTVRADEIRRKSARHGDDWAGILRTYSVAKQPNFWPELANLRVRVLAVAGQLDRKYAHLVTEMGQHEQVDIRLVDACGHIVHHERPTVFLDLLQDFLRSLEASTERKD